MIQQSIGRNVKVRVYATVSDSSDGIASISYNNGFTEFGSVQSDQTPGYRIKGKIIIQNQTISFQYNPIFLSIYNLGKNSRSIIESSIGTKLECYAGYGPNPKIIGVGNILWAKSHKDKSDYITEILVGDGHFGLVNGLINTSFKGSVTCRKVVDTLIAALDGSGIIAGTIDVPDSSFNNGVVLNGSPLELLTTLAQKMGCAVLYRANVINIVPLGSDIGNAAININYTVDAATGEDLNTGGIGIPEVHPPGEMAIIKTADSAAVQNALSLKILLRAEIGIGQKLNITSKFVNGQFVTARIVQDFDSWDGPFYSEIECFKAGGALGG